MFSCCCEGRAAPVPALLASGPGAEGLSGRHPWGYPEKGLRGKGLSWRQEWGLGPKVGRSTASPSPSVPESDAVGAGQGTLTQDV